MEKYQTPFIRSYLSQLKRGYLQRNSKYEKELPESLNQYMDHSHVNHPQAQCTIVLLVLVLVLHNMKILQHLHHTIRPLVPVHEKKRESTGNYFTIMTCRVYREGIESKTEKERKVFKNSFVD